ncbi:MAG TPA: hypothetical protein VNI55_13190 [Gaiellaceae bacterium]|nr:hypothetical protein [Gaiellaceae bacterium]
MSRWALLRAAGRRFAVILAIAGAGTSSFFFLGGLLLDVPAARSISLGLYLVGCFLMAAGFFLTNRGPLRVVNEESLVGFRRPRVLRAAPLSEQSESLNTSVIMVVIGLVLVALAAGVDPRVELL